MKIVFATQEYPPETAHGGIGTQIYSKAHALAARGHHVWVVSRSVNGSRSESSQGLVHVIRVPGFEDRFTIATEEANWLSYSMAVAAEIEQLRLKEHVDFVEFADWGCESYVHLINRTEWNYLTTVIQLHGPLVMFANALGWPARDSRFFQVASEMERTTLQLADFVYSSSDCSTRWCVEHYGLKAADIPTLHTGVDTQLFRPLPIQRSSRPTIVFVGKIERTKGVEVLVEAVCRLAPEIPGLHLRLAGRGNPDLAGQLQKRVFDGGWRDLVDFMGFVDRENLPAVLSPAHVFAAPSFYEGGPGFVYLEAMACGLPAIACAGSGASEAITAGETGLLVEPRNVESLVNALRYLLTHEAEREAMGQRAFQFVQQEANSESCLTRLEDYYIRITAEARRSASGFNPKTSKELE